jgi:phage terminase large subunit GpA-like protein
MDTWQEPWIREVFLCFAPQTGKTQVAFNCLIFGIDQRPGSVMYIMPDEKVTKRISRRRLLPLFRGTPRIAALMSKRLDDTSSLAVQFTNGADLMMAWATSPAALASESVMYLFMDEIDKYPEFSGKESDPVSLARQRLIAYPFTSKLLGVSTPTTDTGYIIRAMADADEIRDYHVPCPICGEYQIMVFDGIIWPGNIRDPRLIQRKRLANYQCSKCGMFWDDHLRDIAVQNGKWIARAEPVERPTSVAFHLPSWYSPFISLSRVAADWLRSQDDPSKLMAFVTQHKAEAWQETIAPKKESAVLEHCTELPSGVVPSWAVALTAYFDTQKHGFWFAVRAWDAELNNHLVQYGYVTTFEDVEAIIFRTRYPIQDSKETMDIWRAGIDTGGGESENDDWSRTEEIYQWLRKTPPGKVYGTKGASHKSPARIKVTRIDVMPKSRKAIKGGLELRLLATDQYKEIIHWRLERNKGESQYFSLHAAAGMDYARQLLAEEKARTRRGKIYWKQVHRDNHLLDCEVGNAALADSAWLPSLQQLAAYLKRTTDPAVLSRTRRRVISSGVE